jgi:hypothetical protein
MMSRRNALALVATLPTLPVHALEPDPVLAAIEQHRNAYDYLGRCCTVGSDLDQERFALEGKPEPASLKARHAAAEAERDRASDLETNALWGLVDMVPTNLRGVAARLEYLAECETRTPRGFELPDYQTENGDRADVALMLSTAKSLRAIMAA